MSIRAGRPRASSRETISEAACELFLEQGYEGTSITDITRRAGVARSSFFNYFASKSDVFWSGFDERIDAFEAAGARVDALATFADGFEPDSLALAFVNADQMLLGDELDRESALRRARIGRAVSTRLRADGMGALAADVVGAAHGAAVLAAVERWARDGAGRTRLPAVLAEALAVLRPLLVAHA
ncbi:helix-turn-helix domain-containing protein [Microbacterium sp. NPDC089189]|uniref:TetR/AcrR family transcriptional regulator n=1 Tax=Microbacterium sp. NPDC089189 TaxID=3154972 RepID=UPI00341542FF